MRTSLNLRGFQHKVNKFIDNDFSLIFPRQIRAEYEDSAERAERLSLAREYCLSNKEGPIQKVEVSDLHIYLQWLVAHHNSMKTFACFMKVTHM